MKNKLLKTELIFLLKDRHETDAKNLDEAYDNFITKLHYFIHETKDLTTSFFILNHTRIELIGLKENLPNIEKKKAL